MPEVSQYLKPAFWEAWRKKGKTVFWKIEIRRGPWTPNLESKKTVHNKTNDSKAPSVKILYYKRCHCWKFLKKDTAVTVLNQKTLGIRHHMESYTISTAWEFFFTSEAYLQVLIYCQCGMGVLIYTWRVGSILVFYGDPKQKFSYKRLWLPLWVMATQGRV